MAQMTGSGMGQTAGQLIDEMQKAQQEMQQQLENVNGRLDELRASLEGRFQYYVTWLGILLAVMQVLSGWQAIMELLGLAE